ncbi:MAG: hypothetical protein PVI97_04360 [Candidatus Thiodiazotropha sp.]
MAGVVRIESADGLDLERIRRSGFPDVDTLRLEFRDQGRQFHRQSLPTGDRVGVDRLSRLPQAGSGDTTGLLRASDMRLVQFQTQLLTQPQQCSGRVGYQRLVAQFDQRVAATFAPVVHHPAILGIAVAEPFQVVDIVVAQGEIRLEQRQAVGDGVARQVDDPSPNISPGRLKSKLTSGF